MTTQRITLSHSNDGVLESCARKFEFMYVYQQMPALEERATATSAADVGTAMHEAAQEWARAHFVDGMSKEDSLDRAFYVLALHWDFTGESYIRPLGAAARLLKLLADHPFWREWDICEVEGFGPAIEVPFQIKHEKKAAAELGIEFVTQGKIDFIMQHKTTGEIRCVDLKTTSKARDTWEAEYRYSDQGPVYSFPLQVVSGKPIGDGIDVIYFMLSFSSEERVPGDAATVDLVVQPQTFNYDTELLSDMWEVKHERMERITSYVRRGKWPRTTHGCVAWNRACPYMGVCQIRDKKQLERWFSFDDWKKRSREYTPVWVFEEREIERSVEEMQ